MDEDSQFGDILRVHCSGYDSGTIIIIEEGPGGRREIQKARCTGCAIGYCALVFFTLS